MRTENYGIICNTAHQYAVWPAHRRLPAGWRFTGPIGTRAEMLAVLKLQFVEMVPGPSLRTGTSGTSSG